MTMTRVDELLDLVEDIEVAMMTTRDAAGHLVSRPMAAQKRASGADFWFVTARDADVLDQVRADPRLNLAFYKDRTREYVSVSGTASTSDDPAKIRELYAEDWRVWFGGKDNPLTGPDDPRLVLIGVRADSARFLSLDKPQAVVFLQFLKGMVTKEPVEMAEPRQVSGSELRAKRTT